VVNSGNDWRDELGCHRPSGNLSSLVAHQCLNDKILLRMRAVTKASGAMAGSSASFESGAALLSRPQPFEQHRLGYLQLRVLLTMQSLKELGVRMVLDDFGTGYSALSYLRMFPFDKIKIDRSFVVDMCEREDSRAIVASVVQLAAALGMTTTAEGVESAAQVTALRTMRCDEVQGFFFGRPEPAEQLHRWFGRKLEVVGQ
jgi:hypothetical protein